MNSAAPGCNGLQLLRLLTIGLLTLLSAEPAFAQTKTQMVRIAKIVVDPPQLEAYKVFAKEEIEASVRLETISVIIGFT